MNLHKITIIIAILVSSCVSKENQSPLSMVLVNHLGYEPLSVKKVVFQSTSKLPPENFALVDADGKPVYSGTFEAGGKIANWHIGNAYAGYFTDFQQTGNYTVQVEHEDQTFHSQEFRIARDLLVNTTLPLILEGFQSIHPEKKYEDWDRNIPFYGEREDRVDVRGGWYDASGDYSKYLSHLCYTNYMMPQQTPMVVYNLLVTGKSMATRNSALGNQYIQEAAYGADFLVRMQDEAGYFYTTVFDTWSKDPTRREICAYETAKGTRTTDYQAAFREGAGITIAALARLAGEGISGEFTDAQYLATANKGFEHLLEHNASYCDDGQENTIDQYCALLAAVELYDATKEVQYLEHARKRAAGLANNIREDGQYRGWLAANADGSRPYFHATEAGYPLIALSRYLEVESAESLREEAISAVRQHIDFTLTITNEVHNPFGYARQYVKGVGEQARGAFFIPHQNESGYWYQGENARLASIAAGFLACQPYMTPGQKVQSEELIVDQLNWILGLNPYDMSMLDGVGHNNPEYLEPHNWNYRGGIANGITAGVMDEEDIAFLPSPENEDPAHRWRWPEQWIPHAGWFILAVSGELE